MAEDSELKVYALNPLSDAKVPIFLKSDDDFGPLDAHSEPYIDAKIGMKQFIQTKSLNYRYYSATSLILGIPSLCEADREFAEQRKLDFAKILDESKPDVLVNSNEVSKTHSLWRHSGLLVLRKSLFVVQ